MVVKKKERKREEEKKRRQPLFHAITPSKIARVGRIRVRLNRSKAAGSPRDPVRRLEISTIWRGLFDFLPPSGGPLREERETSSAIKSHKRTADCSILVNTRMFQMLGGRVWRPIAREFFFEKFGAGFHRLGHFPHPCSSDVCDLKWGRRSVIRERTNGIFICSFVTWVFFCVLFMKRFE